MATKKTQTSTTKTPPLSVGKVVRYATTPGIFPLLKQTFGSGFESIAILLAQIYAAVRLLPRHHPYLKEENFGRFTIRHVITEASNHLEWKRQNIDQIVIFFAILAAMIILFMQVILLVFGVLHFVLPQAFASSQNFAGASVLGFFGTEHHRTDLAFNFLDYVFGVPGVFDSNIANPGSASVLGTADDLFPSPFHMGLHALLQFYSLALLIVGALIFLYFILVVVAETAQSGTPFGQRFQNMWVPLRLVLAIGLLVPLSHGLNTSQYITLYTAKYASGLATNTWFTFNQAIVDRMDFMANPLGQGGTFANPEQGGLVAHVNAPDITPIIQFMSNVLVCKHAERLHNPNEKIVPYLVMKDHATDAPRNDEDEWEDTKAVIQLVGPADVNNYSSTPQAIDPNLSYGSTVSTRMGELLNGLVDEERSAVIRFGSYSPPASNPYRTFGDPTSHMIEYNQSRQHQLVSNSCGELSVNIFPAPEPFDPDNPDFESIFNGAPGITENDALNTLKAIYFELIISLFKNEDLNKYAERMARAQPTPPDRQGPCTVDVPGATGTRPGCLGAPPESWRNERIAAWQSWFDAEVHAAYLEYLRTAPYALEEDVLILGWAGAGLWYNKIADINATFINEVTNMPVANRYPALMEKVRKARRKQDEALAPLTQFDLDASDDVFIRMNGRQEDAARAMSENYKYWYAGGPQSPIIAEDSCNVVCQFIKIVFTDELIDMRKNTLNGVNPLAQISSLGKALIESSISAIAIVVAANIGGSLLGLIPLLGDFLAAITSAATSFVMMIAVIGFLAGFILYYVVPFLPYIFFLFAVIGWVKSIVEAMVGAPLWALAHLRIDGEGLPGKAASAGYFLLLDIFLRPVLTVAGLIASIVIFSGGVIIMNATFDLVAFNTGGYSGLEDAGLYDSSRSHIDQFFFTIIFTIIIYILGTSCFKLITEVPSSITRWIGTGAKSLADNLNPTQDLVRNTSVVGGLVGGQVSGKVSEAYGGYKGRSEKRNLKKAIHGRMSTLNTELAGLQASGADPARIANIRSQLADLERQMSKFT